MTRPPRPCSTVAPVLVVVALLGACSPSPSPSLDGGPKGGSDGGAPGSDAGPIDAGGDPTRDAGVDAGPPQDAPGWWRGDVPRRRRLAREGPEVAAGYALRAVFDHAELVETGRSSADGRDVHVIARDGETVTDLPRLVDPLAGWGRADTTLWFPAPEQGELFLYYGEPSVPARDAAWSEVFAIGDDFEDGTLDAALSSSMAGGALVTEEQGRAQVRLIEDAASAGLLSVPLPEGGFALRLRVSGTPGPGLDDEVRLLAVEGSDAPPSLGDDAAVAARTRLVVAHRGDGAVTVQRTDAGGARSSWDGAAWAPGEAVWAAVAPGTPFVLTLVSTGTSWRLGLANGSGALLSATMDVAWSDTVADAGPRVVTLGEPWVERGYGLVEVDWLHLRPYVEPEPLLVVGDEQRPSDPRCDDGVQSGDETGPDCGGGCGGCPVGAACLAHDDCAASRCGDDGTCALAESCLSLLEAHPSAPTGSYEIDAGTGVLEVFCEMSRAGGGWTRAVLLDAIVDGCPDAWTFVDDPGVCAGALAAAGERGVLFDTPLASYGEVMGFVLGYGARTPDAFGQYHVTNPSLDEPYVDGVSITTPAPERAHVWTYAAANRETEGARSSCPCRNGGPPPAYVGDAFYCEAVSLAGTSPQSGWLTDRPLWDEEPSAAVCDVGGDPSWFEAQLASPRAGPLEVRILADEGTVNEDIGVARMELYVR